ncbi:MAG: cyclodeaminase/cyclohydrolase family protein [Planctomycetota bacterium]|nr:cyclodeaminase/cyclohydrolase family protein [Planctomycetota bacterium]
MGDHDFQSPSVATFLERLGSDTPTPGGGTAAAVAGAMGAALVRMLAVLTLGRKKYEQHERLMQAVADQADEERTKLLALAADDAAAYDAVGAAFGLPKETEAEKTARTEAIQVALKGACDVPLRVMERCIEVIALAKTAVQYGNRNALSDGAAGAEFARAAMRVAGYNVRINLSSIKDAAYTKDARTRMEEIEYMGGNAATWIDSHVNETWNG